MYDLDKKLLDLNNQILSYRLAMNRSTAIDPFTNPLAPPIISPSQPQSQPVESASTTIVEEKKEEINQEESKTPKGARGKRGKRGPKGDPGKDFDPISFRFPTKIITTNYSATNEDCFIFVNATSNVELILPSDVLDGKLIIVKNGGTEIVTTLKTDSGAMVDGGFSLDIAEPLESVTLICNGGDWFIIGNYLKPF